jgi:hypothetical protein
MVETSKYTGYFHDESYRTYQGPLYKKEPGKLSMTKKDTNLCLQILCLIRKFEHLF